MKCCIYGASELGTACAVYLHDHGYDVLLVELPEPRARCRMKSYAEAVFVGEFEVEGIVARSCHTIVEVDASLKAKCVPIVAEEDVEPFIKHFEPEFFVNTTSSMIRARNLISLKVGVAGVDCKLLIQHCGRHAGSVVHTPEVTETDIIGGYADERFVCSEQTGRFKPLRGIGERITAGTVIGEVETCESRFEAMGSPGGLVVGKPIAACSDTEYVASRKVEAPISGVLLGIVGDICVFSGMVVAEIDPSCDSTLCHILSATSRCVAGSVVREFLKM